MTTGEWVVAGIIVGAIILCAVLAYRYRQARQTRILEPVNRAWSFVDDLLEFRQKGEQVQKFTALRNLDGPVLYLRQSGADVQVIVIDAFRRNVDGTLRANGAVYRIPGRLRSGLGYVNYRDDRIEGGSSSLQAYRPHWPVSESYHLAPIWRQERLFGACKQVLTDLRRFTH